ncbi:hypothetical protein HZC21_01360 [Candidatus Peregrinibacteria bacterium]|nr:hypothetical protein [Candidatus Peregrinibacteria bacterium]
MRVHSLVKIHELKRLRKRGYSLNELVKTLSIPKTTIWHHARNVKISHKYHKILEEKRLWNKKKYLEEWDSAQKAAEKLIKPLTKVERILIAASLYWGEGAKRDFSLSNTDPNLIRAFVLCLKSFGVSKDRITVSIRLYGDLNAVKAVNFWAKVINVPKSQIKYIHVLSGKKEGKLLYGMCRLRITRPSYLLKFFKSVHNVIMKRLNMAP